jgi:small GTP-binding protein
MSDLEGKLKELREEYAKTKHNKATNKHLGILRRKIANIKKDMVKKKGGRGTGFAVKKSGDATAVLVGFPNAGKSSLLTVITNAESRIAAYAFTTLEVIPGTMTYQGAQIQILDVPGLIEGASEGKGSGAKVASVIRVADLLLIMLDVNKPEGLYKLLDELYGLDIRINKTRPNILIEQKATGGLEIEKINHKTPSKKEIAEVLNQYGIYNGKVIFHQDADIEDVMELMDPSMVYVKAIIILNKIDSVDSSYAQGIKRELENSTGVKVIPISASQKTNIEELKPKIFGELELMRIYLKPKDGEVDFEKPLIMKKGATVYDVAKELHSKAAKNLRYAYISGKSAKFTNQRLGREHVLLDGDCITLIYDKS